MKTVELTCTLLAAAEFAAEMHRDQRRKGVEASPYINHPIQVASIIANVGKVGDISVLAAALLHDTIEDTEVTAAVIEEKFGATVCKLVLEVTDDAICSTCHASGNKPGIHRPASAAGKAMRNGARVLSDVSTPASRSDAITRRAWRSPVPTIPDVSPRGSSPL